MRLDEYLSPDATGLAELVGKGEVTAAKLLALARERGEQVNPADQRHRHPRGRG